MIYIVFFMGLVAGSALTIIGLLVAWCWSER